MNGERAARGGVGLSVDCAAYGFNVGFKSDSPIGIARDFYGRNVGGGGVIAREFQTVIGRHVAELDGRI